LGKIGIVICFRGEFAAAPTHGNFAASRRFQQGIVGVERIRQYQVPLVSDPHEIWQVVIVRVAVVEEAAFLDQ
jgi:hypothetical protein